MFDSKKEVAPQRDVQWTSRAGFGLVCILVIVILAWGAEPAFLALIHPKAEDSCYNLLVQGFRAGQLNVKREAPPGLAQLADPYNPALNAPYQLDAGDMSYYQGKLYLYFGVTPAVVLFWPYVALTGHYLSDKAAVVIFFALGFLTAAGLLRAIWRRCFREINLWVPTAGILTLGLALGALIFVSFWCDVYEVAVSCGFAFTMLALAGIWGALQETSRRVAWLLLASLAYGLAIGARPSLLFGGIILLLPVIQAWRAATEPSLRRRAVWLLLAAVGPILMVGLGLMLYNFLRFDNPLEFGWHYQLSGICEQKATRQFSLRFLWVNLRFYFLEPVRWSGHFPFVNTVVLPSSWPSGYIGVGESYGGIILSNCPLAGLVLAAPLVWRGRSREAGSVLRWFVAAVVLQFMVCASTLCLFVSASIRYGFDFLPALLLLSLLGILGLERALVGAPGWRHMARWGWCLLLVYSVVINLLVSVEAHAKANLFAGNSLVHQGRADEAVEHFQKALALEPESAVFHGSLGTAYYQTKRLEEAITQYQIALKIDPDFADAHNNLGLCLFQEGRVNEAIAHYQRAVEIKPDFAEAHKALGDCLFQTGRLNEAILQYQKAVEIKPDYAEAHSNLGYSLFQAGRVNEAIAHFQRAVEIKPDFAKAHNNLGGSLFQAGRVNEAIAHFQRAVEIKPDYAEAQYDLGCCLLLLRTGRANEAFAHLQKALEIKPDLAETFDPAVNNNLAWSLATDPDVSKRNGALAVKLAEGACRRTHFQETTMVRTLAAAYAEDGRFDDAIDAAQKAHALAFKSGEYELLGKIQEQLALYHNHQPYRESPVPAPK